MSTDSYPDGQLPLARPSRPIWGLVTYLHTRGRTTCENAVMFLIPYSTLNGVIPLVLQVKSMFILRPSRLSYIWYYTLSSMQCASQKQISGHEGG